MWELVVPSVTDQLALALSQRHLRWCRGDGKEQPGHREQGQFKRGNTNCLLGFRAPADSNSHGLVAWLATTERDQQWFFFLFALFRGLYIKCLICSTVLAGFQGSMRMQMHKSRRKQHLWTELDLPAAIRICFSSTDFSPFSHPHHFVNTKYTIWEKDYYVLLEKHMAQQILLQASLVPKSRPGIQLICKIQSKGPDP